ncbi:hypothetical protein GCM10023195_19870 [Actinoallomurus liliacearum]|uniref:Uncharacterized protein n=1 Tax=Actinoallomurus liliacearum TaxID=1080073 RepID=A0ABP8TJ21_9ACTN
MTNASDPLLFGIYPGGATGDDSGGLATGPADDPERIRAALDRLRPDGGTFLVRGYVSFVDADDRREVTQAPERVEQYAGDGRVLDLVAQYQSHSGDVAGYVDFVRDLVLRHGHRTATLQITEEPNVPGNPTLDGHYPRVREAVIEGVLAAADEAGRQGFDHLRVGFNTTPLFGPGADFIASLTDLGGKEFIDALGYVGLDFFPDVFQPIAPDRLHDAITGLVGMHRAERLTPAGIAPEVPIHITENGWPTGPDRAPERQAEVLETTVRAIAERRTTHNVRAYTHFALRDADSAAPGLFHRFGLLTDDYRPKPAFAVYQEVIGRFGG